MAEYIDLMNEFNLNAFLFIGNYRLKVEISTLENI